MTKGALAFLLVAVLSVVAVSAQNDYVITLTDANITQAIAENKHIILDFYTSWCPSCKKLEPEFARAAAALGQQNVPVKLAKVNCEHAKNACMNHNIRYIPTLKYFVDGVEKPFYAGRTEELIVNWVKNNIKQ